MLIGIDLFSLVADSVICTDADGRVLLFNRAAEQSFGYSAHEVIGQKVEMLVPSQYREQHARSVAFFADGQGVTHRVMGESREVWGLRKTGEKFPAEAVVSRNTVDGRTILTVVHRDITERKELDSQRDTISRELDHRTRNVLTVVASLVSLSARSADTVRDLEQSLLDRLNALASTQALLHRGKDSSLTLGALLLAELGHYRSANGSNITIPGKTPALSAAAVQPLALVFHELATNSAKYGALSVPAGQVTVAIGHPDRANERMISIEWIETGGPLVSLPTRQGFGTQLILQMARVLKGSAALDFPPTGLVFRMVVPGTMLEQHVEG